MDPAWQTVLDNRRLVGWFLSRKTSAEQVRLMGGPDDAEQLLLIVLRDAACEAQSRGLKLGATFARLALWRMDDLTAAGHLVRAPSASAQTATATIEKIRRARSRPVPLEHLPTSDAPDVDDADAQAHLHATLRATLSPHHLAPLALHYGLHGQNPLTFRQVAARLGIPRTTVAWRINYAMKKLRRDCPRLADLL